MLQAYIDDSKTKEDVLVLAGYIAQPQRWDRFSLQWRQLLSAYPSWHEFKMGRAARRPEETERFCRIVEDNVAAYVACVLEIGALRRLCRELALPMFFYNPYNYAIKAILDETYKEGARVGLHLPIEFIFDERGEKKHVDNVWPFFVRGVSAEVRPQIHGRPRFESSIKCPQLQAAEIIAWRARKHWLRHRGFQGKSELLWHQTSPIKGHLVHWDYDVLKPKLENIRELLLDWNFPLPPIAR
jgi:hypothetical protein